MRWEKGKDEMKEKESEEKRKKGKKRKMKTTRSINRDGK